MVNAAVKDWKNWLERGLSKLRSSSGKVFKPMLVLTPPCRSVGTLAQCGVMCLSLHMALQVGGVAT